MFRYPCDYAPRFVRASNTPSVKGPLSARHRANNLKNVNFASHPVSSRPSGVAGRRVGRLCCGQRAAPHLDATSSRRQRLGWLAACLAARFFGTTVPRVYGGSTWLAK